MTRLLLLFVFLFAASIALETEPDMINSNSTGVLEPEWKYNRHAEYYELWWDMPDISIEKGKLVGYDIYRADTWNGTYYQVGNVGKTLNTYWKDPAQTWQKYLIKPVFFKKSEDSMSKNVYERSDSFFADWKKLQDEKASKVWNGTEIQKEVGDSWAYHFDGIEKRETKEHQWRLEYEAVRMKYLFDDLFPKIKYNY